MGITDVPKALYKANQAKKKMAQIKVAGKSGFVGVLMNGLSDNELVEVDRDELQREFPEIPSQVVEKLAKSIENNVKGAFGNAKKELERELIKSTNLDDIKKMLSAGE